MSELRTNRIVPRDGLPSGSSGGIIQVRSTTKTDTFSSSTTGSFVDVTGLAVTITPHRADSKILVTAMCSVGNSGTGTRSGMRLVRDSTPIAVATDVGSRTAASFGTFNAHGNAANTQVPAYVQFLDSPATTSAVTYKIQLHTGDSSTMYVNRTGEDANNSGEKRGVSTITVMEVSG
tara:strand:+ start:257 stop:787 length:531 start_codon:yes stop_codon:yes gene_type:complete